MAKRLLTGIKPTGDIHIGNYFGAMRPLVDMQSSYESFIFIADLHALNQIYDAERLRTYITGIATAYLAIGLDPQQVCLFRQSQVPAHSELCWILNCITSMGHLERAHAYKDAVTKKIAVNMGLFDYPVLMAADILLYQPEIVPVGHDQQQHVEMTIDIAQRFHHLFGPAFTIPQGLISESTGIIQGLDGRKMSKSYNNVIGLFDPAETVKKKVMSIVTDSAGPTEVKDPTTCNIFALHKLFSHESLPELEERYRKGSITYKESKEILAENINSFLDPIRSRKAELETKPDYIADILEEGRKKAVLIADATLATVKERVGL